ncbi:hypothetical protein BKI52_36825 [marine bacterium AO1-C]|nr:hypothetical protein BKI52_36825 [marine bacterium AO1-C]
MSKKRKQQEQAPPPKKKKNGALKFFLFIIVAGAIGGGAYVFLNEQTDPSLQQAINYYNHLQNKNFDQAVAMFDQNMFKQYSKEEWQKILQEKNETAKGIAGYKINLITRLKDSQNEKRVIYATVQYGDSTRYEQVHFLKSGEQFKVLDYLMKGKESNVDRNTVLN